MKAHCAGFMFHYFDPATHQCKRCGRWQPGYAPPRVSVKPRAECQVCERKQAVHVGRLWHHGYRRPGWGSIVGDCFGVGHAPFPATDALELWKTSVQQQRARTLKSLAELPGQQVLNYFKRDWNKPKTAPQQRIEVGRGAKADYRTGLPSFESLMESYERTWTMDVKRMESEIARVTTRIAKGNAITKGTP